MGYYHLLPMCLDLDMHVLDHCSFFSPTGLLGALWDGVAAFGKSWVDVNLLRLQPFRQIMALIRFPLDPQVESD